MFPNVHPLVNEMFSIVSKLFQQENAPFSVSNALIFLVFPGERMEVFVCRLKHLWRVPGKTKLQQRMLNFERKHQ